MDLVGDRIFVSTHSLLLAATDNFMILVRVIKSFVRSVCGTFINVTYKQAATTNYNCLHNI